MVGVDDPSFWSSALSRRGRSVSSSGCGFTWQAPRIPTPGVQRGPNNPTSVPQKCCLPKGHDGPHRSLTGVTTP